MTPGDASSPGLSPRALTTLAYLGGWATGAVVWFLERERDDVRRHAAQSVILFGALTLLSLVLWVGSFAALATGPLLFTLLQRLGQGVLLVMIVLWLVALWQAWSGRDWRVPLVGRLAARASTSRRSSPPALP